jgi:hypothetical protein
MLAVALAAWASGAVAQELDERFVQDPGAERMVIVAGPTAKDDSRYFPKGAPASGRVLIRCSVTAEGAVADCALVKEDPAGSGLAAVALQEVNLFRFKPMDRDGKSVAGRKIILSQVYMAPGDKDPGWLKKPTAASLAAVYPLKAAQAGRDGTGYISCRVTVEGFLDRCEVTGEDPEGYGFGQAALTLSTQFAMTPKIRGGRPVEGRVRIPVNWKGLTGFSGPVPKDRVLSDPKWASVPTADAIRKAYPAKAAGVPYGQAALRCHLGDAGQARLCEVASEIPAGMGFGAAARSLAPAFAIAFAPEDAGLLKTTQVDIPFRFRNPTAPDSGVLTDVEWTTTLSAQGAALLFPAAARAEGLSEGLGSVNCAATLEGRLADCHVVREEPASKGFGVAAMQAATVLRMNRWTTRGDAVEGRRLTLPIRFKLEAPKPAAAPPKP